MGRLSIFGSPISGALALTFSTLGALPLAAQTMPFPMGVREAVGVERGSTALIGPVDRDTYFLTFDTFGSEDIGPSILSAAAALPNIIASRDQLDAVAVLGGPVETGRQELLAGGLGYRIKLSESGTTLFVNGDYADIALGSRVNRALDATGANWNLTFGARHAWRLSANSTVTGEVSLTAREWKGEVLDTPTIDEDLRVLRAGLFYSGTTPLGPRGRLGVVVYKGISGLGSSDTANPLSSLPGASSDFLSVSFTADVTMPVTERIAVSVGTIGQWSDASLPFSQRCGYGTNEFSRAFDRTFVNGDKCLGGRGEIGYSLPIATLTDGHFRFASVFAAADAGWLWNLENDVLPASQDTWASVYAGLRAATSNLIAEASLSRIIDEPEGIVKQDKTRFWFRSAVRF